MKIENIKFRGKSKRTGEWLYGDLVRNVEGEFAIVPPFEMTMNNYCGNYEVDKETIGQFTGLYDENEREIYEGDIVDWVFFYMDCNGGAIECDTIVTGIIDWYQGGFILKVINNDFDDAGQYGISDLNTETTSDVVVKGNIHDNKELLDIDDLLQKGVEK